MRLTEGIVVDSVLTFGKLRFSALRREVRKQNEDGTVSNEVKERTYNLKSSAQGRMIQVSIPANVPLREFAYDAEVELVVKALTYDEKMFLIMHQGLLGENSDSEDDFDVQDWLEEEESFFMVVEVNENLCRQAESVLEEIGVEMPDAIEGFLNQLVEKKQFPVVING